MAEKFHKIVTNVLDGKDKRLWKRAPNLIVIHHTGVAGKILKVMDKVKRLALHNSIARYLSLADKVYVSAHFQIGYDGEITQIVDPRHFVAYHAGKSQWYDPKAGKVISGCNDFSVGIELLGDGNVEPYSEAQIDALTKLISALCGSIPSLSINRICGHQHIAPKRKTDPGKHFPWSRLESSLGAKFKLTNFGKP
jgi:N-acetyl-anhydromuramyl-L-alanine amidase AmpD